MKKLMAMLTLVAGALMADGAIAATPAPFRPANGITPIDLLGDGTRAMMVVGRRENFNAHSFDLASLYVQVDKQWEAVTFFDAEAESHQLTSSGGADCLLHDFRFVRKAPHERLGLVVADRPLGGSFADDRPVVFKIYSLEHNKDGDPGRPTWYFQLRATRSSKKSYCDVGDAFAHESNWQR